VLRLAVIAQSFSVVGSDGHDRAIEEPPRGQTIDEAADQLVRVGNLSVVGVTEIAIGRRRRVGRVRLVEMQEGEEALSSARLDPGRHRLDGDRAVALLLRQSAVSHVDGDGVVEPVEPGADSRGPAQDVGRHRASGGHARRVIARGQRAPRGIEREAQVVAHAVMGRKEAREERRVRGQGERAMAVDVLEHDAVARERIEVRRPARAVAVGGEMVGAQRIDRDEDDGGVRERPDLAPPAPGGGQHGEGHEAEPGDGDRGRPARAPQRPDAGACPSHSRTRAMSRASRARGATRR
jgi:hypothetical protein